MAWNPNPSDSTIQLVNRFYSKSGIEPSDERNALRTWLMKESKTFVPQSARAFLSAYHINPDRPEDSSVPPPKVLHRKPPSPFLVRFLYDLIFFCGHEPSNPYSEQEKKEFLAIRRKTLKPLLPEGRRKISISHDEVTTLVTELMKKEQTVRWAYMTDFIFTYGVGVSQVCSIKNSDLKFEGSDCMIRLKAFRGHRRTLRVPTSLVQTILDRIQGKEFLFETPSSASEAKLGNQPYERTSVTNSIKRWSKKVLNKEVSPREIAKAKKSPDQEGQS